MGSLIVNRFLAYVVDGILCWAIGMALFVPVGIFHWIVSKLLFFLPFPNLMPSVVMTTTVYFIYEMFFLYKNIDTLGRRLFNVHVEFEDRSLLSVFIRTFLKCLGNVTFIIHILNFLVMIMHDEHESVHDILARTKVV